MGESRRSIGFHDDEVWVINSILLHRDGAEETEYLIKWEVREEDSWIKRRQFVNASDVLTVYWRGVVDVQGLTAIKDKYKLDLIPYYKSLVMYSVKKRWIVEDVYEKYDLFKQRRHRVTSQVREAIECAKSKIQLLEVELDRFEASSQQEQHDARVAAHTAASQAQQQQRPSAPCTTPTLNQPPRVQPLVVENSLPPQSPPDENDDNRQQAQVNVVIDGSFICSHNGCHKQYATKRLLKAQERYHLKVNCAEDQCDWSGPPKRFNEHYNEIHLQVLKTCVYCKGPWETVKKAKHERSCAGWNAKQRANSRAMQRNYFNDARESRPGDDALLAAARVRARLPV